LLSLILAISLAWAVDPPAAVEAVQEPPVEVIALSPEQIWAQQAPEAVLAEVVARRRVGDYAGAERRLGHLKRREVLLEEVAYHWGILAEVQEDYELAVARYLEVETRYPQSAQAADATFRRAYCLEDLGRHKEALEVVKSLQKSGKWSRSDALTLSLEQGIVELRSGKRHKGIKRILKALAALEESNEQTWIRSRARIALVRVQLEEAAGLNLRCRWFTVRRLKARARLMAAAAEQAKAAFTLGEPEFALEGLMLLGDAHVQLYEDMLQTPIPWRIKSADHELYRAAVKKRSAILLVKAHARYDEGVRVAARTQWQGMLTDQLKAKREATKPRPIVEPQSD
jgi:tetratricopeptide (TPR) repeat protein